MRTIVVGDIHGCGKALRSLLGGIQPQPDDTLVFLGDYVDRGPDSRGVIDQILALQRRCRVVALRGNHEIMLLGVLLRQLPADLWQASGGAATLASYGGTLLRMPDTHLQFLSDLQPFHETDSCIFVHAGYDPNVPMDRQTERALYWQHLLRALPPPHCSGKRVFVGHTPQASGAVLAVEHLVCLDTYCFGGGWLTAMHVESGRLWQADGRGRLRQGSRSSLWRSCGRELRRWFSGSPRPAAWPANAAAADNTNPSRTASGARST